MTQVKNNYGLTGMEIAVIGMSGRFPGARNIDEFWNNLRNGKECISFFSDDQLEKLDINPSLIEQPNYVKAMGVLESKECFDASFFGYSPREAETMDPQVRIFYECAWEALENAGYNPGFYDGLIGLYAGASSNLNWEALAVISGKNDNVGEYVINYLINKDHLCSMISFKLNLKGPSITLDTSCSTSLAAIHMACQAISNGECDICLAGGVSVSSRTKIGYIYQEGMILSPDGHCRAFDKDSKGTVAGEGVGIVVLKSVEEAVTDGDYIYALVKGTAINNDGLEKAGYTVPSVEGQAAVIRMALQVAAVEPESIGYIETHGTGTVIGDPIEIQALTEALLTTGNTKKGFCPIGSVKTNIGHLDTAAGVAGFIKTVLALKHRLIPPSLHFNSPNPKMDLKNSPFYVNTTLKEWKNNEYPLRAGASSFGIGGTNVHVILEEWSDDPSSNARRTAHSARREHQLILLSAKTETALEKMTGNLVQHFKNNPDIDLADAAYTLQVGRKAFPYRRASICSSVKGTIKALSPAHFNGSRPAGDLFVVFMFPGQGSQYVNMGLELYQKEPVFHQEMEHCFEILKPLMGYDIKEILYPDEKENYKLQNTNYKQCACLKRRQVPNDKLQFTNKDVPDEENNQKFSGGSRGAVFQKSPPGRRRQEINQTEVAQPLLFVFEYALAKLLMKWGIKPDGMIGHSIGEYVAACLSGVFSLEDALFLVTLRGKLMQQILPGAMLSVSLPEVEVTPLLNEQISLAAVNSSERCVVSGSHQDIDAFARELKERGYQNRLLHTSHAFHSSMMTPILMEFEKGVNKIRLNKPSIPYISNVTGRWIQVDEVCKPQYWANHLRKTVRFLNGVQELLKEENPILIEVGPGQALSTFIRQETFNPQKPFILDLVRHPQKKVSDAYYLSRAVAQLWLYGVSVDWRGFHRGERQRRIPLPTYCFEGQPFPVTGDPFRVDTMSAADTGTITRGGLPAARLSKSDSIKNWFYVPSWQRIQVPPTAVIKATGPTCYLLFVDKLGLGIRLAEVLEKDGHDVFMVEIGVAFCRVSESRFKINPGEPANYDALVGELFWRGRIPARILHLWGVTGTGNSQEKLTRKSIDNAQELGFYSLIYLARSLGKRNKAGDFQLVIVTDNMQEVTGEEELSPEKASVLGPCKVIPQEYPNISCRSIDILSPGPEDWQKGHVLSKLLKEFTIKRPNPIIAFRGNHCWEQAYKPVELEKPGDESAGLRQRGVYLVTGGLGNIGWQIAEFLARTVRACLILTGRSQFPARDRWDQWLNTHHQADKISQRIRKIQEIENMGAQFMILRADVSDPLQMKKSISDAEERFGQVNGVIHAAGITGDDCLQAVQEVEKTKCLPQFQAKVYGLLVLQEIFRKKKLDFCLLMSSIASVLGGLGMAAYSAVNLFMDAFVREHNRKNQGHWASINWDGWRFRESDHNPTALGATLAKLAITPAEGTTVLTHLLTWPEANQVVVSTAPLQKRINQWVQLEPLREGKQDQGPSSPSYMRPNWLKSYTAPYSELEMKLADIWRQFFGFKQIGIHDDFFELGGDSLKAIMMASKIHQELNVEISLAELFNRPTIEKLAGYITGITGEPEEQFTSISVVEKKDYYPLFSAQKRLYFLQQLDPGSTAYHIPLVVGLEGSLDPGKLEKVFRKLINRHESLRTSFMVIHEEPVQRVHDEVEFEIEYYDFEVTGAYRRDRFRWEEAPFGQINACGDNEETAKRHKKTQKDSKQNINRVSPPGTHHSSFIIHHFVRPFDLSQPPLLRVGIEKTGSSSPLLLVDMHHIITDRISQTVLQRDFMSLYRDEELLPLRLQYKDYAHWHNSEKHQISINQQKEYWINMFSHNDELPVLNLPTDYLRPLRQSFEGSSVSFVLTENEDQALKALSKEVNATLFMTILSIFTILLSKLSNQEDIIVGVPIAGRPHADLESIIGMFANTLALRNYPSGEESFKEFLIQVKERTLKAFENQEYPFEALVENVSIQRDISRNPIFDVMFNLLTHSESNDSVDIPGVDVQEGDEYVHRKRTSKFDLNLTAVDNNGKSLYFDFEYCTKLFNARTIERIIGYFRRIVALLSVNPELKLADLEIMTEEEKAKVLEISRGVEEALDIDQTIHGWFEDQAVKSPDSIALVMMDMDKETPVTSFLSYRELNARANQLAIELMSRGVTTDIVVGLMVERSFEMIIGILAIMKAGGAYMPVDIEYPEARKEYMLKDSEIKLLITNYTIEEKYDFIPGDLQVIDINDPGLYVGDGIKPVYIDNINSGSDLVYVIYTSGSTGNPKGVMLEHRNLVNLLTFHFNYTNIDCSRVLQFATISFDASFHETFSALLSGGELYLINRELRGNIPGLFSYIEKNDIKTLFLPMSFLRTVFSEDEFVVIFPRCVGHIQTAGEQVVISDKLRGYLKENYVYLHNHYGPSETHVVTALTLDPAEEIPDIPPIGKPILNTSIFILDKKHHLLPPGIPGELYIGGIQVGRGYQGKEQLTGERFIPNPFAEGERLYKTGDLARWLFDGNIDFLGRTDHQVKIRGFRIELREIEFHLLKHDLIKEAVVIDREDQGGEKYLCAYIVPDRVTINLTSAGTENQYQKEKNLHTAPIVIPLHQKDINTRELRNHLSRFLPDYMIPAFFVQINRIPLTSNGKVNRKALPVPKITVGDEYTAPRNEIEMKLAAIWQKELGLKSVSIHDNFFDTGGNSLKAIGMVNAIHKEFNIEISIRDIFRFPTIEWQSGIIRRSNFTPLPRIQRQPEREYYDLSSSQQRLWYLYKQDLRSTAFNMSGIVTLYDVVDETIVLSVIHRLIRRHESLRTYFKEINKRVRQVIEPDISISLELVDLSNLDKEELEQQRNLLYLETSSQPFDLTRAPLFRAQLVKCSEKEFDFILCLHHIISDGWSLEILRYEFTQLVEAAKKGIEYQLEPLQIQYRDYSHWQNQVLADEEKIVKAREFWKKRLSGYLPILNLPYDNPPVTLNNKKTEAYRVVIPTETTSKLRNLARGNNASLFMVLLAAFKLLLFHITGQEDILMAMPAAARQHEALRHVIGVFVNTLITKTEVKTGETFIDFLNRVRMDTFQALEYQSFPLELICTQLKIKYPEISVFFNMVNTEDSHLQDLENLESYHIDKVQPTKFNMHCYFKEYRNGIDIRCHYFSSLFKPTSIQKIMRIYIESLEKISNSPDKKVTQYHQADKKRRLIR